MGRNEGERGAKCGPERMAAMQWQMQESECGGRKERGAQKQGRLPPSDLDGRESRRGCRGLSVRRRRIEIELYDLAALVCVSEGNENGP